MEHLLDQIADYEDFNCGDNYAQAEYGEITESFGPFEKGETFYALSISYEADGNWWLKSWAKSGEVEKACEVELLVRVKSKE